MCPIAKTCPIVCFCNNNKKKRERERETERETEIDLYDLGLQGSSLGLIQHQSSLPPHSPWALLPRGWRVMMVLTPTTTTAPQHCVCQLPVLRAACSNTQSCYTGVKDSCVFIFAGIFSNRPGWKYKQAGDANAFMAKTKRKHFMYPNLDDWD